MNPITPMQLLQMIKNGQNPQQLILSFLENGIKDTPMGANLLNLARQGNSAEIEKIARNLAKQRGIDYDKEFAAFRRQLGI